MKSKRKKNLLGKYASKGLRLARMGGSSAYGRCGEGQLLKDTKCEIAE